MSSSTSSKRRGHHATKACNGCRRRRCKCDGVHPICGTCSFYGHECTWSQEEDARRPATKQLVESLRVRIRELETEVFNLRAQMQDTVPSVGETSATRDSAGPSLSGSDRDTAQIQVKREEEYPGKSLLIMQEGNITASGPTSMWSTFPVDEAPTFEHVDPGLELTYQFLNQRDSTIPPHMQPHGVQLSDICEWDRNLPNLGNVQFTRLEHDTLLDRYFNFHTIWLRTLVPELFLRDMLAQLAPQHTGAVSSQPPRVLCYSPFLHCAILSVAAALSDDLTIKARETRDRFASCAKQYLESECERPTLTAIQALTCLSDYHHSCGERGLSYLFSGMSCRLTRALGLCIDAQPWVDEKRITPQELILRDWQFWSTFCQDKIMSLDFGRDYDLPLPHLNVNLPAIDPVLDQKPWVPHFGFLTEAEKQQPTNGTLVFFENCKLMLIAVRIMDTVYSQGRQNWRITEKDSVSQIHLLLDTWYNNLPEILVISSRSNISPPPHVITLNIAYWWLLMLLHRPFYARTQRSASNASSEQPPSTFTDLSVKFCDRATSKIVQLFTLFDQCHSLRQFPLNMIQVFFMTGATLLVQSATLSGLAIKKRTDAYEATRKCIRALHIVGQTWACAELSANRLENLLREQTGESPVSAAPLQFHDQPQSVDSSPLVYNNSLPGESSHAGGYNGVLSPSQMVPHMFRDFILSQGDDSQLGYELPALAAAPLQYPELHNLHQHPLMGMPSGSQFMANPHILPLPFDPNFNESYRMGDSGGFYHQ